MPEQLEMTSEDTLTKEVKFGNILKDNLIILTGVGKKGEWAIVAFCGDYKGAKTRNRAFDYELVKMLRECGVREISVVK